MDAASTNRRKLTILSREVPRAKFNKHHSEVHTPTEILKNYNELNKKYEKSNFSSLLDEVLKKSVLHNFNYFILINDNILNELEIKKSDNEEAINYITHWLSEFNSNQFDKVRKLIKSFYNDTQYSNNVPKKFLKRNNHYYDSQEIGFNKKLIKVGEYCNHGFIIPRNYYSIKFDQLYNCTPLISTIKGTNGQDYVSFLHTWADVDERIVDKQVLNWMNTISRIGRVQETVLSPRIRNFGLNTKYKHAVNYLVEFSSTSYVFNRDLSQLEGIVNEDGIFFNNFGYHLWKN